MMFMRRHFSRRLSGDFDSSRDLFLLDGDSSLSSLTACESRGLSRSLRTSSGRDVLALGRLPASLLFFPPDSE